MLVVQVLYLRRSLHFQPSRLAQDSVSLPQRHHCQAPPLLFGALPRPCLPWDPRAHCTSLHQGRQEDHGPGVCRDGRGGGRGQHCPHHSHVRVGLPSSHQHLPVAGEVFNHGGDPGHQVSGSRVPSLPGLDRPSGAQLRRLPVGAVRPAVPERRSLEEISTGQCPIPGFLMKPLPVRPGSHPGACTAWVMTTWQGAAQ